MKHIALFILLLLCYSAGYSQKIENVDFTVNAGTITVNYDLSNCPENYQYDLSLKFKYNTGEVVVPMNATGDLASVEPGKHKTVNWDVLADKQEIKGNICAIIEISNSKDKRKYYEETIEVMPTQSTESKSIVEQKPQPSFDLGTYLANNLHYPDRAKEAIVGGRVLIKFVVNEDGSISNCEVIHSIGSGCDEEAMRVVAAMPKWIPGKQDGKPVKVYFTLPIQFKLE